MVKEKLLSKKYSLDGFDWKVFLLSFERPFIILVTFLVGLIATVPQLAPIVIVFGGVAVIAERLWALVKFYINEYYTLE